MTNEQIVEHFTNDRENDIIRKIFIEHQTMSAIARQQGISLDRVRQIKESGLMKLRMGKAKRELLTNDFSGTSIDAYGWRRPLIFIPTTYYGRQ